jgi:hypothetical protein
MDRKAPSQGADSWPIEERREQQSTYRWQRNSQKKKKDKNFPAYKKRKERSRTLFYTQKPLHLTEQPLTLVCAPKLQNICAANQKGLRGLCIVMQTENSIVTQIRTGLSLLRFVRQNLKTDVEQTRTRDKTHESKFSG